MSRKTKKALIYVPNTELRVTIMLHVSEYFSMDNVHACDDEEDALWWVEKTMPDVIIMHFSRSNTPLHKLLSNFKSLNPSVKIIIVYFPESEEYETELKRIIYSSREYIDAVAINYVNLGNAFQMAFGLSIKEETQNECYRD